MCPVLFFRASYYTQFMMVISGNIVFRSPMVMCSVSAAGSSSKPVVALQMENSYWQKRSRPYSLECAPSFYWKLDVYLVWTFPIPLDMLSHKAQVAGQLEPQPA